MKKLKKICSVITSLALVIGSVNVLPITLVTYAQESSAGVVQKPTFEFKDGVLTFSGSGIVGNTSGDVYDYEWSEYKEEATSIVFEEGITEIAY